MAVFSNRLVYESNLIPIEAKRTGIEAATLPNVGGKNVTFAMCLNLITGGFLTLEHLIFINQMMTIHNRMSILTSMNIRI